MHMHVCLATARRMFITSDDDVMGPLLPCNIAAGADRNHLPSTLVKSLYFF